MEEVPVAQYAYDRLGRLRAEWDPRISPALKTSYGYDSENHVSAVTPPGQESWALTYGTSAGDPNAGRLLKVTRSPASAALWNGEAPKNTEAPKLSGTPVIGVSLGLSHGAWSGSPIVYGYQWEDCNAEGAGCAPIPGATNQNYTVKEGDVGHRLVAVVTATNGGGSAATPSSASEEAKSTVVAQYKLPEHVKPTRLAAGSDGNLWVLDVASPRVQKILKVTPTGSVGAEYTLPTLSLPSCIVAGPDHNLWFAETGGPKIGKITTSGTISEYALPETSAPACIASGPDGNLWYTDSGTSKIGKMSTAGLILAEYALPTGSHPTGITAGPDGKVWFTDEGTDKIGKITTSGTITEYSLSGAGAPEQITAGPNETLWFVRGSGVEKITTTGTTTSVLSPNASREVNGIALGRDNNVWFASTYHGGTVSCVLGRVSASGGLTEFLVSKEGEAGGIIAGPEEDMWFSGAGDELGKATTAPQAGENGEQHTPEPGWTIEYNVPASGPSAPYALGTSEVAQWRQQDDPTEGFAVIPPDEPQGWPASTYKRATIDYLDELGRTVNERTPSGGISTSEYNAANEVTRSLSADNRVAALNETGKTVEASERLDTKTEYNAAETQIVKVRGPQHLVKLSTGAEVQARSVTRDFYDEGAPGGKAYNLLTKTTTGAEYEGKEADVRTTLTGYSGQENLGWELRKPTSTTVDPGGLDLVSKTMYDKNTGNVIETRSPGGNSETIYPPVFASAFGGAGSGNGQFNQPCGIAIDSSGNLWVVDAENGRIEKFSPSGTFIAAYGSKGSGNLQFQRPYGIAINSSTGNVYVGDYGNNRVEELNSSGAYVASFGTSGSGALSEPMGVTLDASGDVWVADRGHNRLVEFSAEGVYVRAVGSSGSGNGQFSAPIGLAISEGSLYAVDSGNDRVEQFSLTGEYLGQFGSKGSGSGQLKEPFGITANPSTGNLYVADLDNNRVAEFSPAGRFLTQWETWGPSHQLSAPVGLAVDATGKLYVSDLWGAKVSSWTPPEAGAAHLSYASQIGSLGSGSGQFHTPIDATFDGEGNLWVSDLSNNRIEKFSSKGTFIATYGSYGSGNGQFNGPGGIDVNQSTGNVYVADTYNARIEELSSSGSFIRAFGTEGSGKLTEPGSLKIDSAGNVWVPDMSADKILEFSSSGTFIAAYGKEGSGEVQFKKPIALAFSGENLYIADSANHRVQEITNKGAFVRNIGIEGSGSGELYDPEGIAADSAGNLYVVDAGSSHVEEFNASGGYLATFASSKGTGEGQLSGPVGDAIDAAGDMYVVDTENNRVEKWSHINQKVRYTKTIYYSAAANSEYPQCGEHPEWANLACQVQPVSQPNDTPPSLPVTTSTYNLWDESEEKVEKLGSTTRTTLQHYDPAGRAYTSEETSTASNASLPTVTNEYSESTGALIVQKTTVEGKTKAITSKYNTLLQLERYTDADGNTSEYTWDVDGRLQELKDGKGSQIYIRDPATGLLTELYDSTAGYFKATYDVEDKLLSQSYPNGMTASYTINAIGQDTHVEYVKTTDCASNCTWFSDAITFSIHGEPLSQVSSFSSETYATDATGRLTKTLETPVGKGCTTRLYAYDEESDRTSLTTREPAAEGKCAEEGGTTERHIYDEAGRLMDAGVTYDALGNATSLPASDAGGHELLATYYVDNQVHTQTQNGETLTLSYDPAGRDRETVSTGKTSATDIVHYTGPGSAVAWTSEGGESWSRNITGIDGTLDAIQTNVGAPVLQLHDLLGNVVGTAALSESETKLLTTYNSVEFGTPQPGTTPPKYAWLGAGGVATEPSFASGASIDEGASYVPQVAKDLQTEPIVPPGAFPDGRGTESTYMSEIPGWYIKQSEEESAATLAEYAAKQEALRREAEAAAAAAELEASAVDPYEWAMLTEDQGLAFAEDLKRRAENANLAADFFKFLPKIADELATSARGLAAAYEGFAHNVKACALASDRCFVTVGYVTILGFSFITSVKEEPCFYLERGYDLCQPTEYVRRQNEHGRD